MSNKTKPQIKCSAQGLDTQLGSSGTCERTWTANECGNVVNWLAQRAPQQPSRGAIDYLCKAGAEKPSVPAVKSTVQQLDKPTQPKLQTQIELSHKLMQVQQKDSVYGFDEKVGKTSHEVATSPSPIVQVRVGVSLPIKTEEARQRLPQGDKQSKTSWLQRSHGRYETKEERLRRRYERMTLEAQKRHEEAMRTDPDYKKKYQTFQERQSAQQMALGTFFERYSQQGHLNTNNIVSEAIDIPVILDLIEQHDVVFICTDTGSGKSTSVPKALLELSNDTRVVSTQPRRTATVSIASHVAALRRERVGEDVGYWIRGDKCGDQQTRLWYMTSYTFLLHLLSSPLQPTFTHVILDEFHERQPDIEVTVALLRLCLLRRTAQFKLILMSATLNTADWEAYFAGLKVATYKQSEPKHLIHDYFMEDVCAIVGVEYDESPNITSCGVSFKLLEKHTAIAQALLMYLNTYANPQHAILVFLPGRAQVEQLQSWLEMNIRNRVHVVPWHSAVDLSVIEAAIKLRTNDKQKIYLATDIAEVSITLPDVVFVIDFVVVKRPKINRDNPSTVLHPPLMTQWASKGSIAQRRGRIGRVQQGFYFCLLPSSSIALLPDYSDPPIENSRIDELSLHCLQVVSNPVAIFSICHGQPLLETITLAMDALSSLGCIVNCKDSATTGSHLSDAHPCRQWGPLILEEARNVVLADIEQYEYTFIGRLLQLIPISPQPGMLVLYGLFTGLESLMILAASVTSSLSPFMISSTEEKKWRQNVVGAMEAAENVMRDMCCGMRSDVIAAMKAVLLFRVRQTELPDDITAVKEWCISHRLSYDKLKSILDLEQHIKYELANFIPVRDVSDAVVLLAQFEKVAPIVLFMLNAAFVAQALEVLTEGNTFTKSRETAVGIFTEIMAVPDIHAPSCLRWQEGDIVVPVQLSILSNRMLASFSTAIASQKQFWLSLLLLTHRLKYALFADDEGEFFVFSLKYYGTDRYLETDALTGRAILLFRQKLSGVCQTLRLLQEHQELYDDEFAELLKDFGLKPLEAAQRDVITAMATFLNNSESITVDEVEHDEDDLDEISIISQVLRKGE
ncbi:DEAD DEAH box helicase Helicase conserved C terminal domain [Trypanosoma vivax]|uniref:Putative ATP-dependent RNA helicase n=1 Tax=Trypanosoma vivax (strain Y486) TaxID=1055687 RepID=G0TUQ9_TRYVY|nr:putative ATP-dependent RNA helicase [Trypanosoma vivax]KAH8617613.1 DEAD DEAH box helicase Helicase conserved C terminal domain [Trypanosoma vivax]CCC47694.1 putative ATP-dependent RNA helicase [Trypanosoma vivax Y486]